MPFHSPNKLFQLLCSGCFLLCRATPFDGLSNVLAALGRQISLLLDARLIGGRCGSIGI